MKNGSILIAIVNVISVSVIKFEQIFDLVNRWEWFRIILVPVQAYVSLLVMFVVIGIVVGILELKTRHHVMLSYIGIAVNGLLLFWFVLVIAINYDAMLGR